MFLFQTAASYFVFVCILGQLDRQASSFAQDYVKQEEYKHELAI